jgi:hypothetical protein
MCTDDNNYTLVIRSLDRIYSTDTATGFSVNVPQELPDDAIWKVTFYYCIGWLSGSTAYSLQVRSGKAARAFTTNSSSDDGYRTVQVLNGTEPAAPFPMYFNGNPRQLQVRLLIQSNNTQVNSTTNSEILTHWERVDMDDKECCYKHK